MTAKATKTKKVEYEEKQLSNGAEEIVSHSEPYLVNVKLCGTAPLLMHAWNIESIEEKAGAKKGSVSKKTDDVESYVYRDDRGFVSLPGKMLTASMADAGRYMQDPRSPRKSARDLIKAGVQPLTAFAPFLPKTKEYDYLDRQRVVVQRSGITRTRPAMKSGWEAEFQLMISLPEYLSSEMIHLIIDRAGKLCGLADFRPTYGRFAIVNYNVARLD